MSLLDTIVAIATPPGRGGIGVVRLSGPEARAIAEPILRPRAPLVAGRARFAELLDPSRDAAEGAVLDQVVVTFFAAPNSYTADDVVEISMHGAPVLLHAVLQHALRNGARLAEPGEFTERAYRAGRLDLTAAEAVRDLIDASTLHQARTAAAQLGGGISRAIAPAKRRLVTLIAQLEAGIDFAEDDLEVASAETVIAEAEGIAEPLATLAGTFAYGRLVREGVRVALAGQPNAGKSSLFNRLLGRDRAIVTAQAGTTRDVLTEQFALGAVPVELMDTAGLRDLDEDAVHEAERAGIARTRSSMAEANHVLLIVDATRMEGHAGVLPGPDRETLTQLAGRPVTVVFHKSDLLPADALQDLVSAFPEAIAVSSLTGAGVDALRSRLQTMVERERPGDDTVLITGLRQQTAIAEAIEALWAARTGAAAGVPHEVLLLELQRALSRLDGLTGETTREDVLREIFSTFCIGK